jgi:hypothetical protein
MIVDEKREDREAALRGAVSEVTQEDREAAADVWRDYVAKIGEIMVESAIRRGSQDDALLVQVFASHRIAAREAALDEAAGIARECMLLLSLGTPGEGPFTRQDRAADETREVIAQAILAAKESK